MIDMGSTESLAQAFAVWAVSHPRRPALCPDGGKTRNYEELAAEAWAVADALRRLGIVGESRIAVLGGRTAETVVAILGVLIAGAAYCPIDPKLPAARRRQILDELKPAAMVVADPDLLLPADMACPVLPLTDCTPVPAARSFVLRPEASALAYVLFTSGSTGRPRGVMVENGSVCNMLRSYERIAPATDGCLGALIAPTAFDVSVWEIFSALAYGGTLYVPSEDRLAGGDELWDYLAENGIQSAYIPPGLLAPLLSAAERKQGALHRVLVGVEPIPQHVLQRLCAACPGLRIVNGYGPTETTITATLHLFRDVNDPHRRVPIGRRWPAQGSRSSTVSLLRCRSALSANWWSMATVWRAAI
jgi:non-ribosomal peptide synthetase component F